MKIANLDWNRKNIEHLAKHQVLSKEVEEVVFTEVIMGKKKLPDMSRWTESQISKFWDTHSPLDFEGEIEPAELVFERLPLKPVAVKLSEKDIQLLKRVALAQGVGYTTIIRMWIKERLKEEVSA